MARTRARSVVMSASGQAADYYRRMNMNESRRAKKEGDQAKEKQHETERCEPEKETSRSGLSAGGERVRTTETKGETRDRSTYRSWTNEMETVARRWRTGGTKRVAERTVRE